MKKRIFIMTIPLLRLLVYAASTKSRGALIYFLPSSGQEVSSPAAPSSESEERKTGIFAYISEENNRNSDLSFCALEEIDYVQHFVYSECEEEPEKEWEDFIAARLQKLCGSTDTAVVIKEAWKFDWGGTPRRVVFASNFKNFQYKEYKKGDDYPVTPPWKNPVCYIMIAVFADGAEPFVQYYWYKPVRNEPAPDFPSGYIYRFYPKREDEETIYMTVYGTDENGISEYRIFQQYSRAIEFSYIPRSFKVTIGRLKDDSRYALFFDYFVRDGLNGMNNRLYFLEDGKFYKETYRPGIFDLDYRVHPDYPTKRTDELVF